MSKSRNLAPRIALDLKTERKASSINHNNRQHDVACNKSTGTGCQGPCEGRPDGRHVRRFPV